MKRSRASWWVIYGACAALALGGLAWITAKVLELERSEQAARAETRHQETLRLALWRMDSWFGPLLAREAARPFFEYLPFHPPERAFTRMLEELEAGEVLSPSPLLTFRSPYVRLHFQVDMQGAWTSPQVPTGEHRTVAATTLVPDAEIAAAEHELQELADAADCLALRAHVRRIEGTLSALAEPRRLEPPALAAAQQQSEVGWNGLMNRQERGQRDYNVMIAQTVVNPQLPDWMGGASTTTAGPLVALWLEDVGEGPPRLLFVRAVHVAGEELLQGFLGDWDRIREELLKQVGDLAPDARLTACVGDADDPATGELRLASIPARFDAGLTPWPGGPLSTPTWATLAVSWLAALLALGAVGFTLRASVAYGDKRSRFASAVTHELRTPLTTFRMYSEMLAKGMVPEDRVPEYLCTLQRESDRLSGLVENVLAYARLEEGTAPRRRERLTVGDLISRALPELEGRVTSVDGHLQLDVDEAEVVTVETDVSAVKQILFNLVDNACKYGSAREAALELSARATGAGLELRVRDHGAGISPSAARTIFRPFERGELDAADPNPGIGLGLALARGLACDLGGDLILEHPADGGACFCLRLPF